MNVLVVDDYEVNRIVLVLILQKLGYSADTATNGLEAVAATRSKSYQLIFMDIYMPFMGGISAAEEIVSSLVNPPHIIAVATDPSAKTRCQGFAGFIEKPISFNRIKQCIDSLNL
ncbi:CheY-like chemotaxis protein [Paenibacillus favisporus]|uniref:CheY-like chemotaxis protein n=1 Tax=Paenibacillus favisporus TaxID=221028 RepID=A0ABV2F1R5_9BACL